MWQPGWEGNLGENGYIYMYGQVPLLFTWNYHNIVNDYTPLQKKKKKRVCGTCPWKWPSDCQVNACQASWKPHVREVEAPTLWKRARCAKGHSPLEQKGSGKWFSLCFHLSRCWTCADAKQHPLTGSQPWQLPQRDTPPGIKAVLRETDWRPCSLVLHFWIIRQITFLKGSKSRWSFWTCVKPGNE